MLPQGARSPALKMKTEPSVEIPATEECVGSGQKMRERRSEAGRWRRVPVCVRERENNVRVRERAQGRECEEASRRRSEREERTRGAKERSEREERARHAFDEFGQRDVWCRVGRSKTTGIHV
jgi:hypothetical protein